MTKKDLKKSVLNKIKEEKVKPIPRWEFILQNSLFWALYIAALILGSISASVIIFKIAIADWDLNREIGGHLPGFIAKIMPLFWLALFALLLIASYYNLRHTKKGYHYKFSLILGSNILLSFLFGSIIFHTGIAKQVENVFLMHAPFYERMEHRQEDLWSQPEKGLLAGKIIEITSGNTLVLIDFEDMNWVILLDKLEKNDNTNRLLQEGHLIKILGESSKEKTFSAIRIKPWEANLKHQMPPKTPRPRP
jgi:hypothetical protein